MSPGDSLRRYRDAMDLTWTRPPDRARRPVLGRPPGDPIPPLPDATASGPLLPSDVRGAAAAEAGAMVSRSLPGLDVTVMMTPPDGDAVHVVQGRAWRNPPAAGEIRVVLVQGEHVLAESTIDDGGHFRLEDLLLGDWSLEFRLGEGSVVVLHGASS